MNQKQALKIAIRELKQTKAALAFDANAYYRLGARYPQAVRAARRTREILTAVEELRTLLAEPAQSLGEEQ